jgi:uncharacterized protein (TIGR03437 family)
VASAGLVYVGGFSDSTSSFPVSPNALQHSMGGDGGSNTSFPYGDGFVAVINPNSPQIVYCSYFGGTQDDEFFGLVLDGKGGVWAAGNTVSSDFPVTASATQRVYGGHPSVTTWGDAVLVHFSGLAPTGPIIGAIENAASNAAGQVSPGMIFTLYGSSVGPATLVGASLDSSGKLATMQAGFTITFDGIAAPIVYVSAAQSAGVVPYEIANHATTNVVVTQANGQSSVAYTVPVTAAIPGLFSANFTGTGPAVAFNEDSTLNSAANAAAKGSVVVLFGTGEGQTIPAGVTGFIAVAGTLPVPAASCSATVAGLTATVLYCGAVPNVVTGEFQMNLQLPPDVPSGNQPVVVQIGTAQSQANLTVFVK